VNRLGREGGDGMNTYEIKNHCENHLYRYVLVTTRDQQQFDAIVEAVDDENVYFAVPIGEGMKNASVMPNSNQGGFGYGYGGGFYPGYGYPYYPPYYYGYPRRFQRLVLPLAALAALSVLPYF